MIISSFLMLYLSSKSSWDEISSSYILSSFFSLLLYTNAIFFLRNFYKLRFTFFFSGLAVPSNSKLFSISFCLTTSCNKDSYELSSGWYSSLSSLRRFSFSCFSLLISFCCASSFSFIYRSFFAKKSFLVLSCSFLIDCISCFYLFMLNY